MQEESGVRAVLADKFAEMRPHLDERQWRLWLGAEARALVRAEGCALTAAAGVVARAAGASATTVAAGAGQLAEGAGPMPGRSRGPGAGRKKAEAEDPGLAAALRGLLDASTRGDPVSPLRWTTLSLSELAAELARQGFRAGRDVVARMLHESGFSLRGVSRTAEGSQHRDRDAQFRYISAMTTRFLAAGDPVISVDAKKKELVGPFGRAGRTWRPEGDPVRVRDHDFPDPRLGKVAPYGIYDVGADDGFVNVGIDHDTPAFAAESVRRWRQAVGRDRYPGAGRLLIIADAGGSNGYRPRVWKAELARLAAETGLEITVLHFPPGTSKWNKIEHRLFCHITRNWRGRPLTSYEVIINTIAAVTTSTGLTATAVLDLGSYPGGVKVSRQDMRYLEERILDRHAFHGDWNYTIRPAPGPAPEPGPDPEPPAPGPDPALAGALAALAGIDLPALAGAVTLPWQAAREQHLHLARGHARTRAGYTPARLTLDTLITATACHHLLGMTWQLLGDLLGLDHSTLSRPAARLTPLLEPHGITQTRPRGRISTPAQLREHAATRGITIPDPATHPEPPN
jgi:Rhodopirellula transposase DDE domain